MKPANDPAINYRDLVRLGYERCADAYAVAREEGESGLPALLDRLAPGSEVLDIGCGAGVPVTASLAEHHRVTGIDLSSRMIELARARLPAGRFLLADVLEAEFEAESFDAAVAMYMLFHVPRERQREVFRRVHAWLKLGGRFLVSVSENDEAGYTEDDFFGVTMYWSNYDLGAYLEMLDASGFNVDEVHYVGEGYADADSRAQTRHPVVLASKVREERAA
ncbi:MAG: methyltransferase domain-containing protein [Candidatus Eisenbacteria bacterium]|nr:methyltransferase domain-containing protein [Candidatus Latescibacterota bacterium]MBD3302015.1 methyltransferase domain-containing protein [Candidatus Eisenbacteria bacterium]